MNPANAYALQKHVHWTRIDMLIALYDKLIGHVHNSLESDDAAVAVNQRWRAMRVLAHLRMGIDETHGELPQQMKALLEFVHLGLLEEDAHRIRASERILASLREALETIRTEAIELERDGKIPRLDSLTTVEEWA